MDSTSTPIIYQLMYFGNEGEEDIIEINNLYQQDKQLQQQFREFENNIPEIPDILIDKILQRVNIS